MKMTKQVMTGMGLVGVLAMISCAGFQTSQKTLKADKQNPAPVEFDDPNYNPTQTVRNIETKAVGGELIYHEIYDAKKSKWSGYTKAEFYGDEGVDASPLIRPMPEDPKVKSSFSHARVGVFFGADEQGVLQSGAPFIEAHKSTAVKNSRYKERSIYASEITDDNEKGASREVGVKIDNMLDFTNRFLQISDVDGSGKLTEKYRLRLNDPAVVKQFPLPMPMFKGLDMNAGSFSGIKKGSDFTFAWDNGDELAGAEPTHEPIVVQIFTKSKAGINHSVRIRLNVTSGKGVVVPAKTFDKLNAGDAVMTIAVQTTGRSPAFLDGKDDKKLALNWMLQNRMIVSSKIEAAKK